MQKVHKDTEKTVTLWGLGWIDAGDITLTFTPEQLKEAGYPYEVNIFDMMSLFKCNLTIEETSKQTVRYSEIEEILFKESE